MKSIALIVGAGSGLSASLAGALHERGHQVVLVARRASELTDLIKATEALTFDADASDADQMDKLFVYLDSLNLPLAVAAYNASFRTRGSISELVPAEVERALSISAFGAFLMAHHASKRMLPRGEGALLFTGASAGVKGFANSAPFAMGKFALRGLCQSLARELHPKGIHVGHFIVDGGIDGTPQRDRSVSQTGSDNMLHPDRIVDSYLHLLDQHRSVWSWEMELRPWVENF